MAARREVSFFCTSRGKAPMYSSIVEGAAPRDGNGGTATAGRRGRNFLTGVTELSERNCVGLLARRSHLSAGFVGVVNKSTPAVLVVAELKAAVPAAVAL